MTTTDIMRNREDVDPMGWLQTARDDADTLLNAIGDNECDSVPADAIADLVQASKRFHLALELFNERAEGRHQ